MSVEPTPAAMLFTEKSSSSRTRGSIPLGDLGLAVGCGWNRRLSARNFTEPLNPVAARLVDGNAGHANWSSRVLEVDRRYPCIWAAPLTGRQGVGWLSLPPGSDTAALASKPQTVERIRSEPGERGFSVAAVELVQCE
jgi:hypothetical protein